MPFDQFEAANLAMRITGAAVGQMPNIPTIPCNGKQGCEQISRYWARRGIYKTADEIWNYSPTGELFMVFQWLNEALSAQQRCLSLTYQPEACRD